MIAKIIATGSSGNSILLKDTSGRGILLDAGLSLDSILQGIDFSPNSVDLVLVTHHHLDHLKAVPDMLDAFMPVAMSTLTAEHLPLYSDYATLRICEEGETMTVGNWIIKPFDAFHDAPGSLGYLIYNKTDDMTVAYVADTGYIKYIFPSLNVLITECNYDDTIESNREEVEDRYLRLRESHMSLGRLKSYLSKAKMKDLRKIILIHLSDQNSNEKKMVSEISAQTGVEVKAARQGMEICLDECPF